MTWFDRISKCEGDIDDQEGMMVIQYFCSCSDYMKFLNDVFQSFWSRWRSNTIQCQDFFSTPVESLQPLYNQLTDKFTGMRISVDSSMHGWELKSNRTPARPKMVKCGIRHKSRILLTAVQEGYLSQTLASGTGFKFPKQLIMSS
jgi:hypothetical protein